jgi:hypothetical protein
MKTTCAAAPLINSLILSFSFPHFLSNIQFFMFYEKNAGKYKPPEYKIQKAGPH